ncbi:MAG TPA: dynamin family protein [Methylomirabilota bacterium]|jgi:GTPase Era involved in 16S rRNA processing|nr:dynamin family protein [Methylomirabilota bacterium]
MEPDAVHWSDGGTPGLETVARLAHEVGLATLAAEAERSMERIAGGRFYVACVGQFKRGKSTLLNALIAEPILPTGVVPVTSVVTVLRFGTERTARVRFTDGAERTTPVDSLAAYVSEEQNPENEKQVDAVEVFVPATLLESGMCLVDTPGVGSVFAGGSRATRAFVPQIDAALVVLGADPPISGEELALVEEVAGQIEALIVVLSKADRLSDTERHEAERFTARVLETRLGCPLDPILQVSPTERLAGHGPARDWDLLVGRLADLARHAGAGLVKAAEERTIGLLAGRLLRGIDEQLGALRRPLEETERRLDELRRSTADLDRALEDLRYLLTAEQDRVSRSLTQERARFLPKALGEALLELQAAARALGDKPASDPREAMIEAARDIARRHLDRWLEEQQPVTERQYRDAAQPFVDLANGFLASFQAAREFGLDQLPPAVSGESGLRVGRHLFYTELLHLTTASWLSWMLDVMRPRTRALKHAMEYLERLLWSNSSRIQNDLIERVAESRRQLETEIRARLGEALEVAERALERARQRHNEGREAASSEIERLEALRREAEELGRAR